MMRMTYHCWRLYRNSQRHGYRDGKNVVSDSFIYELVYCVGINLLTIDGHIFSGKTVPANSFGVVRHLPREAWYSTATNLLTIEGHVFSSGVLQLTSFTFSNPSRNAVYSGIQPSQERRIICVMPQTLGLYTHMDR